MSQARKPRDARADTVTDTEWAYLFGAPDGPGVDRGEWWSLQWDDPMFRLGRPSAKVLWREHGHDVVRQWITKRPGSRPAMWWQYSAPEKERHRVGGVGTPMHECTATMLRLRLGLPVDWLSADLAEYFQSEGDFPWPAADPADPPLFESQAEYLRRHNLLTADERKRLQAQDFEPEPVVIAE